MNSTLKTNQEMQVALAKYADTVRRICFLHLKNHHDTEDLFQTIFLKYALYEGTFDNAEHEKAWMIRVSINACKDLLKSAFKKRVVSYDLLQEAAVEDHHKELLSVLLTLPSKYKEVLYLFYYEDYSAAQISKLLGKNENTIYTRLARARTLLKEALGGEVD